MREEELHLLPVDLREAAINLHKLGIDEFGWLEVYKQKVFDSLLITEQPIIGGDIYYEHEGRLEPAYANWNCVPVSGESKPDFVRRSLEYASQYLEKIECPSDKRVVFVPVLGKVV